MGLSRITGPRVPSRHSEAPSAACGCFGIQHGSARLRYAALPARSHRSSVGTLGKTYAKPICSFSKNRRSPLPVTEHAPHYLSRERFRTQLATVLPLSAPLLLSAAHRSGDVLSRPCRRDEFSPPSVAPRCCAPSPDLQSILWRCLRATPFLLPVSGTRTPPKTPTPTRRTHGPPRRTDPGPGPDVARSAGGCLRGRWRIGTATPVAPTSYAVCAATASMRSDVPATGPTLSPSARERQRRAARAELMRNSSLWRQTGRHTATDQLGSVASFMNPER